jgi:hypothetical protein
MTIRIFTMSTINMNMPLSGTAPSLIAIYMTTLPFNTVIRTFPTSITGTNTERLGRRSIWHGGCSRRKVLKKDFSDRFEPRHPGKFPATRSDFHELANKVSGR